MSVPPDLPLWRRALALMIMMTGVFVVCAGPVGEMVHGSWMLTLGGIVGGLACGVLVRAGRAAHRLWPVRSVPAVCRGTGQQLPHQELSWLR